LLKIELDVSDFNTSTFGVMENLVIEVRIVEECL